MEQDQIKKKDYQITDGNNKEIKEGMTYLICPVLENISDDKNYIIQIAETILIKKDSNINLTEKVVSFTKDIL